MFAKREWFQKRKYGGWGISPKSWQGWVYIGVFVGILLVFNAMPFWSDMARTLFLFVWLLVFGVDVVRIMMTLEKDELEERNEAIAERNASWAMVLVLTAGVVYQIVSSGLNNTFEVDPFLAFALAVGLVTKGMSYFLLERK
jgi:hypothetical protein